MAIRTPVVICLQDVEKYHEKQQAIDKIVWRKVNTFTPRATAFRDGTNTICKVLHESSQRKSWDLEHDTRVEYLKKQLATIDLDGQQCFLHVKQLVDQRRSHVGQVTARWMPGDCSTEHFREAKEQITSVEVNVMERAAMHLQKGVEA